MKFTVCISLYKNDSPEFFSQAFDSIINQTLPPSEVILVIDGPIEKDLQDRVDFYIKEYSFLKILPLKHNVGLGMALNIAVRAASYELIARMDSDDIAIKDRFEKQIQYFVSNPKTSIVGGGINEFIESPENIIAQRICPSHDSEIKHFMKYRCGFNHMTVMFRKKDILEVGNYRDWFWNEDYYLWIRLWKQGFIFGNISDPLVDVRVGKDLYNRRGGIRYFKSEAAIQRFMFKNNLIPWYIYVLNIGIRFVIQILLPNNLRGFFYKNIIRKK